MKKDGVKNWNELFSPHPNIELKFQQQFVIIY